MNIHDRAWDGCKVVVLAKKPMQAMQLEQSMAAAWPGVEVQLSSFENYDQAYEFCKEQKDVGFIFVHENCGESNFVSAFRELASRYSNFETPAYGVVLYDTQPNAFTERSVGKSTQLLDYLPTSSLLDQNTCGDTLSGIWEKFIEAFETTVLPKALQASVTSVAEEELGPDTVHFTSRLVTNLLSDLNVTWQESVALKWSVILKGVKQSSPAMLKTHELLNHFIDLCSSDEIKSTDDAIKRMGDKSPLAKRVHAVVEYLETHRQRGTLASELMAITAGTKPGAPKLTKHIVKNSERILSFQKDAIQMKATA